MAEGGRGQRITIEHHYHTANEGDRTTIGTNIGQQVNISGEIEHLGITAAADIPQDGFADVAGGVSGDGAQQDVGASSKREPSTFTATRGDATKAQSKELQEGYVRISDDTVMYDVASIREGTSVYEGYQEHVSEDGSLKKLPVAIKRIISCTPEDRAEIQHLFTLASHPNIVRIICSKEHATPLARVLYIVMELCSLQNLQDYLEENRENGVPFDFKKTLNFTKQLVKGMKHIHDNGIVHRDVRPENVLLSTDKTQLKFCDFGIAKKLRQGRTSTTVAVSGQGTIGYMAPETHSSHKVTKSGDIFCLGVTLFELWSNGLNPYGPDIMLRHFNIVTNKNPNFSGLLIAGPLGNALLDLIKRMLQHDPRLRPTIDEVLNHINAKIKGGEELLSSLNLGARTPPDVESVGNQSELNEFREERRMPSTKERCLRLFCAIRTSMAHDVCEIISETFKSIDLSGCELSLDDSEAIGFVINRCSHLEIVNLHACKLKPSSLQRLKKEIEGTPKIDKFRVTSNPDLTLDDYKAGVEFCAAAEAAFVYNPWHLPGTERKILKAYVKIYQPQDETNHEQLSKQRRRLTREEKFQKMYKRGSSGHLKTGRVLLKLQSKSDQDSGEDPGNSSEIRQPPEGLTSVPESYRLREQQNEKEVTSDNVSISVKQLEENPNTVLEEEIKSRSKKSRRRPQTLNELVKMKPLMKFQEMMETYAKEGKLPEFENLGDQARMSRRIANNADRQRFEAATLKKYSPQFQAYARQTRNEVSTVFKKSSKGDSGYKSKSSFSDIVSSKASRRRFSRTSDQGTNISSSIDSTRAASLQKIEEELYSEENQGSCDSGNQEEEWRKEQFDPRVIAKQRLEMTCLGLGIMQTKKERIEDWLKTAEFNVTPLDLATSDLDENFQKLNIIKDEVRENMGDLLDEVERDMNHGMKSDLEENFKTPTLKINDEVREVMSDILHEVERANNQETMSDRGNHAETSRRVQLSSAIQESGKSSSESTGAVDDASSVKSNLVSSEGEAIGIQKKSESTDVIGYEGEDIELSDFKISFPKNSVTEDVNFRFFVKSTKQKYLKGHIEPIAPILTVQPSIKLNKPALVTVRTWFSAFPGGEASGQVMIEENDGAWKEDRLVALSDRNEVSFEVNHFSRITVGKESNVDGIYYLLNETYIQKGTATAASAFYKDETTQSHAGKDFLKLSYFKATPNYQQITGKIHTAHNVTIVCIKPDTAEYVAAQAAGDRENTSRLHINQVLEDALVQLFFFSKS